MRYVALWSTQASQLGGWSGGDDLEGMKAAARLHSGGTVYELGPEAKEPDYSLLVEWVSVAPHGNGCRWQHDSGCDCGLTDALKAAGL